MKNAIIYCRVSTKDQVQNYSLGTQQQACEDFCKRNGYSVTQTFIEEGESAKTANRTELKKMLAYCKANKGQVAAVVVYALNRFSRNTHDHLALRAKFADMGTTLKSVTEPIEDSSSGRLMESVLASFAQFDNDVRTERTQSGMKSALQAGRWTFKGPLGYVNVITAQGEKTLAQEPDRAPLIRKVFELYATGHYTKQQVLEKVTVLGLKQRNGKRLHPQMLFKILRNPIYAGMLRVNKWESVSQGNFKPIISRDLYERVQDLITGRRKMTTPRERNHSDFPLRHFTVCDACGKPLTGSWSRGRTKDYPNYRCQNRACKAVHIRKEKLEGAFVEHLVRMKPKPGALDLFEAVMLDVAAKKRTETTVNTQELRKQVDALKLKKEKLVNAFLDKQIDQPTYREMVAKIDREIALKESAAREEREEETDLKGLLAHGRYVLSNQEKLWEQMDLNGKQRLQSILFPNGLRYGNNSYRTSEPACIYKLLDPSSTSKKILVAPRGIEPRSDG